MSGGRLEDIVSEGRVKLHIFGPSNRRIWTVVGRGQEHWIDPHSEFCSCPGFYFAKTGPCYHLESIRIAIREERYETVNFSDDEFPDFVAGLVADL